MIAKSQENIQLSRKNMSVWSDQKKAEQYNDRYLEFLKTGIKVDNRQIIRDKAQSLAYAMKDRFYSLKEDGVDLTKLTEDEYKDLFGVYDETVTKQV